MTTIFKDAFVGKRVVVAGGSRGIGRAIALGFAAGGAAVSLCARGAEGVNNAVAEISALGAKGHGAPCDLADGKAVAAYIEAAAQALGGIDILINNASGFGRSDDEEGWAAAINVDLLATVRASRAALPHIERAGCGSIIHISSIAGLVATTRTPPYGAIKAALIQYTQTQAALLAKQQIRVNCVAPGSIEFPGGVWDQARQHNRPLYDATLASIPFGRLGTAEEIADTTLFLASDLARWITGQTIVVDGGQMLAKG
ncbi:SDR family NAD(P)-dependent oxidoreductase [Ferrovibrio sp.]|uniref:SDR family NAD(P)-dependent oxidoreductase n=1 Tax=Ferrovibrio sp. TaxID=1917215 RepID=UPI001B6B3F74|nr:SDR family NAD(P)-dependent oxidoreductase [Ferrovibrio sp.]MBP7066526.1 SDR family oxidoreductase [Ferrovibrio sp.]